MWRTRYQACRRPPKELLKDIVTASLNDERSMNSDNHSWGVQLGELSIASGRWGVKIQAHDGCNQKDNSRECDNQHR